MRETPLIPLIDTTTLLARAFILPVDNIEKQRHIVVEKILYCTTSCAHLLILDRTIDNRAYK